MAFGYDGSIRIRADLNRSAFDRGITAMTKSTEKFGRTLMKVAGLVGAAFSAVALVNFGKEAINAASALNDAWMGLQSIIEGQGRSFSKAKSFINDYISDGLVPLENAVTAYKNLAARGYDDEQIQSTLTALKDAAAFGRQASYSLGDAVTSATEGLKNENSILVDNAGVTKNVAKMWDDYAKSIGTTANNLTQEQKIQAEVNGILEETRFQTGDAAKLVNAYSGQIALLGYNFQNLKVQVGNALMPIAQAVLPGINAIIAALTKLATVFAQVTAMLFGKSTQVTVQNQVASSADTAADATDKLSQATAGAGSAAKKAEKDMKGVRAGFDELNVLASNAADSLDSASGGLDMSGAEVDVPEIPELEADTGTLEDLGEKFQSLGELFKATLDDILAGMPAFRDALLKFSGNFNEFNQKLYDAFTFPGVVERVQQLGTELAKAFNDMTTAIDWRLWGQTLGSGLNLGLQFLVDFLYTFDWINLGNQLAQFINGIVAEVDWYAFGQLLWAKFKIALETFAGFITGLDMPELARAASNIIMGFFNEMENTLRTIDWAGIGRQVAEFLNNIDWIGVISSIASALESMVEAGIEFVAGFISNADPDTLLVAAAFLGAGLVRKLVSAVIGPIAKEVVDNILKKIADSLTTAGLSGIFSKIGSVVNTAFLSISSVLTKIGTVIGSTFSKISAVVSSYGQQILGIGAIIGGVALTATSFFDMWNEGFSWAKEAVMLLGIALTAVGAIILGAPALITGVVAGIVAIIATGAVLIREHWDEIREKFIEVWEAIKEAWSHAGEWFNQNVIEPVANFFSGLWENVQKLAGDAWNKVQEIWSAVSEWFNTTVIEPVKQFFTGMWDNVKQLASTAWDFIKNIWAAAANWFNTTVIEPVKKFFSELWEKARNLASEAWTAVQNAWRAAGEWFRTNITEPIAKFFSTAWSNIKTSAAEAWENVKNSVFNFWSEVKSWWSSNVAKYFTAEYWKNLGKSMINGLLDGLRGIFDGLRNWASDVWDTITGTFSSSNARSTIKRSSRGTSYYRIADIPEAYAVAARNLPHLANGAVIPPNQQFAAILGDQRSGTNIETPAALIRQMVAEGIQAAGGVGQGGNMTIVMEIDGREFGRASYKYGTAEQQRVGVRLTEVRT